MVIDLSQPVKAYFIDDDPDDFDLFRGGGIKSFKNIGLVPFADCEMMLEILKENTPHILFIDINLGKTTGVECLQVIKSITHLSTVPKIIMSTSASNLQIAKCVELGCHYYLQKPSSFDELISEVQKIFERDWDYS